MRHHQGRRFPRVLALLAVTGGLTLVACIPFWPRPSVDLPAQGAAANSPTPTIGAQIPGNETMAPRFTATSTPTRTPTRTPSAPPTRTATATSTPVTVPAIALTPVVTSGLSQPVALTHAGDGSGRIFVTEQDGRIRIIENGSLVATPFLDITNDVSCCGEQGLLSVAFHPDFANNRFFYVNYTDNAGDTVVKRFTRSAGDARLADPTSGQVVLTLDQPYDNHNGGQLQFGPDGYLYIATGDGGSGGNSENRAQNIDSLLGKMLRIDVDHGAPYTSPATNPYVGKAGADEIWAIGLRNPWRFSFDRANGDLWIGDVGQNALEEVDYTTAGTAGVNYGWRRMEGLSCYNPGSGCNDGTLTLPVLQYDHGLGCAISGGYRYRGPIVSLRGAYFYGDYCSGRIWAATGAGTSWSAQMMLDTSYNISAFGEDEAGALYVLNLGGAVYRVTLAP